MRNLLLPPINRQGTLPADSTRPWYKIVNKAAKSQPAKVYLYDAIGGWFGVDVNEFIKELNDIENEEIHLHINSPGGSVYDGIAIYNTLKQHDALVTTYVDALAASAASFIALAAEKVIVARNSTMMIHDAMGICMGNQADMLETAGLLDKVSNNIADIYAFNAGGTTDEWRALMKMETWYSAQEAVDAGLADEMLDANPAEEDSNAENSIKWDLAKLFNYAGRSQAPSPVELRKKVRNQLKETPMAKGNTAPKNQDGPQGAPAPSGSEPDESQQTEGQATGDPEEEGTEVQTPAQPAEEQATPPAQGAPAGGTTPVTPAQGAPDNRAPGSVLINGVQVTDMAAVQSHISALETFRSETIEQSRRDFVAQLARDKKIAATQIESMTNVALSLNDEQFTNWSAAYSAAPSMSMFENHGVTPTNEGRPENGQEGEGSIQDRINVLQSIVDDHRRTGMNDEVLKEKASYKELETLKAQLTNN